MNKKGTVLGLSAALVFSCFVSHAVHADIPAQIEVYARWEQLKNVVIRHFPDAEANALQKSLQKTIDVYSSRPLHRAYMHDPSFINLGSGGDLLSRLVELAKPHLLKGESGRVRALFDMLNKGKMIQGVSISRNYSGCLLITLELTVSEQGVYEIKAFHAPLELSACRFASSGREFKGITFIMSTGIAEPAKRPGENTINKEHQYSFITFIRGNALWIADSYGSGQKKIASADTETVSALSPDGQLIIYHAGSDPQTGFGRLYRVSASGGNPEPLNIRGFVGSQYPSFSPDGRSIVFVGMSDVKAKKTKGFDAVYATMSVAVFDIQTGSSRRIITRKDVLLDTGYVFSHPSFSPDGRLIAYQHSGSDVSGGFSILDLSGKIVFRFPKSGSDPSPFWRPLFSPDRKQILCYRPATSEEQVDTIYMIDLKTGEKRRITEGSNPAFVESGKAIVFVRWVDQWNPEGNAKSDLWYLELKEGAEPKKILDDASHPAGAT